MASSDRFPVPVRSAVKSNLTNWCCQNLSKRALKALLLLFITPEGSTTQQHHYIKTEENHKKQKIKINKN